MGAEPCRCCEHCSVRRQISQRAHLCWQPHSSPLSGCGGRDGSIFLCNPRKLVHHRASDDTASICTLASQLDPSVRRGKWAHRTCCVLLSHLSEARCTVERFEDC